MAQRNIAVYAAAIVLLLLSSCSKEGKFIGNTNFQTSIQLFTYTPGENAYVKAQIGDTLIEKLILPQNSKKELLFDYNARTPANGKLKVKIWWRNTNQLIIDTTLSIGAVAKLSLIQFDPLKPHTFFESFGSDAEAIPDSLQLIQAQFIYNKDTSLRYPDSLRIKFTTLYELNGDYTILNPDDTTEVFVVNGVVSGYVRLKDSKYKVDGANNERYSVSYGYEIFDAKTGEQLEGFCYNIFPINVFDFNSDEAGNVQTILLGFMDDEAGGYMCNGPSPRAEENYDLGILFGNK